MKRVWAVQCSETILLRDRCQGIAGHLGDHWCFRPDGSYHCKPHETDPKRLEVGCGTILPGSSDYRTPLEMSRYRHVAYYEDSEVTEPSEVARLQRGDFSPNESADLPCTEEQIEELRKLGRLDSDARQMRRERAASLKYRIKDFSKKSTTADIGQLSNGHKKFPLVTNGLNVRQCLKGSRCRSQFGILVWK